MRRKTLMVTGVAASLLAAGACQDSTAPETQEDQLLLQAAVVAADATLEDLSVAGGIFAFGPAGTGGQGGGMGPGHPGGQHGLGANGSGTRDVVFFDAAGNVQELYDPITTARIEASVDIEGEVERGIWTAGIQRTRDMIFTGLEGENTTRIVNGSGSETVSRSAILSDGATATRDMDGTFTYTDVVIPTPGQAVRYPLSGTITRHMTIVVVNGPNGDVDRTVDVTITFDGDETATGLVGGETFEIDLTARTGGFPLHRGPGMLSGG